MKVEQLMTRNVQTCHVGDPLNAAAQIMWEGDCGCVPVVEQEEDGARVVGMITDRDICMAAYIQGRPLSDIKVESAMAREVRSCRFTDSIGTALKILEQNQIHRLPVLDENDHLIGILSLADTAREAARAHGRGAKGLTDAQIGEVIEAISAPRQSRQVSAAA
jgi:CBS-domain-containing membrane protein